MHREGVLLPDMTICCPCSMAGPGPTFTMMVPDLLANRATDTPDWRHSATNVIFSVSAGQEVCLAHQQWAGRVSYFS